MNYEVHPAALLFPLMEEEELGKLADDIAANGLMEPVVLYHGQVLDGRNRLAACELAGVEPKFCEVDSDLHSATLYVASKNLHRRHLSASQRGAIGAEITVLIREEAKARQLSGLKYQSSVSGDTNDKGRTRAIAAKAVQCSEATVQRALEVKQQDPETFEKIKSGEMTAFEARRTINESHIPKGRRINGDGQPAPYEPKTDHQKKLADGQKDRMVRALSQITGLCRGLSEMDVRKALAACDIEERALWTERAKELASQLRAFAARIERGK